MITYLSKLSYLSRPQIEEDQIQNALETSQCLKEKLEETIEKAKLHIFNDVLMDFDTNKNKLEEKTLGTISVQEMYTNCTVS